MALPPPQSWMQKMHQKLLRICLTYAGLAMLWVAASQLLLGSELFSKWYAAGAWQIGQDISLVIFTSLLLYWLGYRYLDLMDIQREVRKAQEAYLKDAAAVFESTQEGVAVTDAQQRIIHVNRALCQITGYSKTEVLGKTPRLFSSGQHDSAFYQAMWKAIKEQGHWSGEIWNRRKNGEVYPEWQNIRAILDEEGNVFHYVAVFSDLTHLKHSEQEKTYLAHYDQLVGLPNRLLFMEVARQSLDRAASPTSKIPGALLLIDLDHFKDINESLGHSLGDALLKQATARLRQLQQPSMLLARLGGDEFALMCENHTEDKAINLVVKILEALGKPFTLDGLELFITASVGIVMYPQDAHSVEQLLGNADSALFKAKASGRSTYAFYSQDLTSQARQRVELATALRQALEQHQLIPYYQPIHALPSGAMVGFEALVRWKHPERGMISPALFIPIAEENDLIEAIDYWMLEEVCKQMLVWVKEGRTLDFVAVNISSRLFHRDLDKQVADILSRTGLPPHYIALEITESAVMQDADTAMILVERLRNLGVRLAIDDFGTGYSSLQRLKHMKVHKLKVDQGFVAGLPEDKEDAAIARSVIGLAHNLGLQVVAEGVENPEQAAFLLENDCDLVQGYGFGRPQPAEAIDWNPSSCQHMLKKADKNP